MIREDCFALIKGRCDCLNETYCEDEFKNFERHECPFYKPIETVKQDRIEKTKQLLNDIAKAFNSGMSSRDVAQKFMLTAKEVAHKKGYLKKRGDIK